MAKETIRPLLDTLQTQSDRQAHLRGVSQARQWHGLPDLKKSVLNFIGNTTAPRRVLIAGYLPGRSDVISTAHERGARVTAVPLDEFANPMTRGSATKLEGKFDRVGAYMGVAFYSKPRKAVERLAQLTDFENNGELSIVSFDFTPMFEYAKKNPTALVSRISKTMQKFMSAGGLNPSLGASMQGITEVAVLKRGLSVTTTKNERDPEINAFPELRDVCAMLYDQAGEALASMPKIAPQVRTLGIVRAELLAHIKAIDVMLSGNAVEATGTPPAIYTTTVKKS